MSLFRKYGSLIFWVMLLVHCLFIYLGLSNARTATKLTLIPILMAFLISFKGKSNSLVYLALLFSFIGDLLLSKSGEIFFLLGMLAFIGTHICNGILFARLQKDKLGRGWGTLIAICLLLGFSAFVFSKIKPNLGNFEAPIIFYMFIICLMAVLAAGTVQNRSIRTISIKFIIPGALFFVLSDTILAVNKFLYQNPLHDIIVMLTYGLAQYLLVKGFIKLKQSNPL